MDRAHKERVVSPWLALALAAVTLLPAGGCAPLLATGIYIWQGGNMVPAECEDLKDRRVVVVCRPPSSQEYRYAGASRDISKRVSRLLRENVPGIDVVNPREVDDWIDENDWGDFKELAGAVQAEMVLQIELDSFELFKGKTLYQGNADVTLNVYEMKQGARLVWDKPLGEILFPRNSGIPAQDKPVQHFQREFTDIVSQQIATHFYKHEAHATFAVDALANR